jgi:sortase A
MNRAAEAAAATVEATHTPAPVSAPTTPAPEPVLYPVRPKQGDKIGSLAIPALDRTLPLLEGTTDKVLVRGVGHYAGTALPGEADNCVVSGHRDTVFRRLNTLKIGDKLIVKTSAGTFTYKVSRKRIVHADDKTVIVATDHAVLTMTTCYPFNYIGAAPDRYIVSADLVTGD